MTTETARSFHQYDQGEKEKEIKLKWVSPASIEHHIQSQWPRTYHTAPYVSGSKDSMQASSLAFKSGPEKKGQPEKRPTSVTMDVAQL